MTCSQCSNPAHFKIRDKYWCYPHGLVGTWPEQRSYVIGVRVINQQRELGRVIHDVKA